MEQTAAPEGQGRLSSWNDGDCYNVSFSVGKSRRYHAMMRAYYRACHNSVVAATAVTGTSAFVVLVGSTNGTGIAKWLTAIVALASTLDLVFAFSKKADLHDDLCRRFTRLAANMIEWDPTEENYRRACAERLRIEEEEPTERRLIDLKAQNDEARARGVSEDDLVPLNGVQRTLGYLMTFGMERLEEWDKERNRKAKAVL